MSLDLTAPQLTLCECYRFDLAGGITAYFTSAPADVSFLGQMYTSIPVQRGEIQFAADLQTDRVEITLGLVGVTLGSASYTIPQIVRAGFLRNAKVTIYLVDYASPSDYRMIYVGYVRGDITYDNASVRLSAVSLVGRLAEIKVPKVAYQKECPWQIYDTRCGLNPDNWDESGSAGASSTDRILVSSVFAYSAHAAGYWTGAKVTITSGANSGMSATVIKHMDGSVKFLMALPAVIASGVTFTAWPNCRGLGPICHSVFNNYANFLGFEYVPNPEALFV